MLLRRITEHVKAQNWTAVALDFFIVVIGVFIGIQVANWNDARANKSEEHIYLQRLNDDLTGSLASLEFIREASLSWRDGTNQLLLALLRNDTDADNIDVCRVIELATRTAIADPQMATIKELIAGGRTNLIRDPELRERLVRLEAVMESRSQLNVVVSNRMDAISPILASRMGIQSPDKNEIACAADVNKLAQDTEFLNILNYSARLQASNTLFVEQMIEEIDGVRGLLVSEIDQVRSDKGAIE